MIVGYRAATKLQHFRDTTEKDLIMRVDYHGLHDASPNRSG